MYGLKPVPFNLKPLLFKPKLLPIKLKPLTFKLKPVIFKPKLHPSKPMYYRTRA
jgi:hypothetical protein